MKFKSSILLLIFSYILQPPHVYALDMEIIPSLGYTNYFCNKVNKVRLHQMNQEKDEIIQTNTQLSSASIGLDIVMITD